MVLVTTDLVGFTLMSGRDLSVVIALQQKFPGRHKSPLSLPGWRHLGWRHRPVLQKTARMIQPSYDKTRLAAGTSRKAVNGERNTIKLMFIESG
jgi:hypothetical protein